MLYVFSATYDEYMHFCWEHDMGPIGRSMSEPDRVAVHIRPGPDGVRTLMGMRWSPGDGSVILHSFARTPFHQKQRVLHEARMRGILL